MKNNIDKKDIRKNRLFLDLGDLINLKFVSQKNNVEQTINIKFEPGINLINQLMERLYELPNDNYGKYATIGSFSEKYYNYFKKEEPFPEKLPDNFNDRIYYDKTFILKILRKALRWRIPEPDIINTVTKFMVYKIRSVTQIFVKENIDLIFVGGEGRTNKFILKELTDTMNGISIELISANDNQKIEKLLTC